MAKRLESPSSINTFKQCKRKYYYQYVEKLPTGSSIHLVRGNIAHSVLEDYYDIDLSEINEENYANKFRVVVQKLLLHHWNKEKARLDELGLSKDRLMFYFEETMLMIMNWTTQFIEEITKEIKTKNLSVQDSFVSLTPVRELEYRSDQHSVRGFIDAIQYVGDEVHIIDYKTNARFDIKDSIKLQLAIYSLLYFEKHGKKPSKLGIYFIRHKLKFINFEDELIELAKREIELIHAHTSITERISDYHRTITPLCKWRTGQCDFYETCKPHGQL